LSLIKEQIKNLSSSRIQSSNLFLSGHITIEIFWKESPTVHLSEGQFLKFRTNFYNATDAQLLHEKGEMKNAVVAGDTDITRVYHGERFKRNSVERNAKKRDQIRLKI